MGRQNRIIYMFFLGLSAGLSAQADQPVAADPASLLSARAQARAGSTVASGLSHDAVFQNPASAAFTQQYAVSLGYAGAGDALTASIVDTKSSVVGGGLYYLRREIRSSQIGNLSSIVGTYARHEQRAGLVLMGRPTPVLAVGANVKYAYQRSHDERIPSGKNWNGDLGAQFNPSMEWSAGIVGQNLLSDDSGLNPRKVSFGGEYRIITYGLRFSAQASYVFKPSAEALYTFPKADGGLGWGVGSEWFFMQQFGARLGFEDNVPWQQRWLSAGLAYQSNSFGADYAFQYSLSGGGYQLHSLSLTAYF